MESFYIQHDHDYIRNDAWSCDYVSCDDHVTYNSLGFLHLTIQYNVNPAAAINAIIIIMAPITCPAVRPE